MMPEQEEEEQAPFRGDGPGEDPAEHGEGEPGIAILAGTQRDPQFWKDCPVELGCILELPFTRRTGEEEDRAHVCVYVTDVESSRAGLTLGVKMLGANAQWCRLDGVKLRFPENGDGSTSVGMA